MARLLLWDAALSSHVMPHENLSRRFLPAMAGLLISALVSGCLTSFPAQHELPAGIDEPLPANVARILKYENYRRNNPNPDQTPSGDWVAEVYLLSPLAGLADEPFKSFELNFRAPRGERIAPRAYRQAPPYHFYYLTDAWRPLMTALSRGDQPMYVRWDLATCTADISADKTFTKPQPWPPLAIEQIPR
jgi:hypothetical protein